MNPGGLNAHGLSSTQYPLLSYDRVREDFIKWLNGRIQEDTKRKYIGYLDRYLKGYDIYSIEDLRKLVDNVERGRNQLAKSIRNLINFYLENDWMSEEKAIKLKRVLKTTPSKPDLYIPTDSEVQEWIRAVSKREDALLVTLLVAYGGLRIREALKILNEFDRTKLKIESVNGISISYYELSWTRGTKNSFVAFMPQYIAKMLKPFPKTSYSSLRSYLSKRKGVRLKYLRKWFINKMFEAHVPESIVKYMIGHSTGSIMSIHYLDLFYQAKREYARAYSIIDNVISPIVYQKRGENTEEYKYI